MSLMALKPFIELAEVKKEITIDDVRITPATITFADPFECRHYTEKITIQNCGKKMAFVRILNVSSCFFKIKPNVRGVYLPAGLKITKTIRFTYYQSNMASFATLPIIVNNRQTDIILKVLAQDKVLTVTPTEVDIGKINVGQISQAKYITIKNDDTRPVHFAANNFMSSEIQFFIVPSKGRVDANSTRILTIQARGLAAGDFSTDIWIRSNHPYRLRVHCQVSYPQLLVKAPLQTKDFLLIDFSYTYAGASVERYICIANSSTKDSLFCILGEYKKKLYPPYEAIKLDPQMKNFRFDRYEGSFAPNCSEIFRITYTPSFSEKYLRTAVKFQSNFTVMRITRLDYQGVEPYTDDPECTSVSTVEYVPSSKSCRLSMPATSYMGEYMDLYTVTLPLGDSIRMYLHGIATKVEVDVVPDELILTTSIEMKRKEYRILKVTNKSGHLPIIFHYEKQAFIDIRPSKKELKPFEASEVTVVINSYKLGPDRTRIKFNLLYKQSEGVSPCVVSSLFVPLMFRCEMKPREPVPEFNLGLTPMLYKEVGNYVEKVRFNSNVDFPKGAVVDVERIRKDGTSDLVAFPNDRPKSMRPWRSLIPIRTIFTKMPRIIDLNGQNESERMRKRQQVEYYTSYIRKEAAKREGKMSCCGSEYDISGKKLLPRIRCKSVGPAPATKVKKEFHLVPLTPLELFYIKITPVELFVGKIAQMSSITEHIKIRNDNNFPIDVLFKSPKQNVSFPRGGRQTIMGHSVADVNFRFCTFREEGFCEIPIYVIVNDTSTFIVTMSGEVVHRSLEVSTNFIEFTPSDELVKYLELKNPFTCVVSFGFDFLDSCFEIEPMAGYVEPGRSLFCIIKYLPHKDSNMETEFCLMTEGRLDKSIIVRAEHAEQHLGFVYPKINIGDVPVNKPVRDFAVLQNLSKRPINFSISNPSPLPGVTVIQEQSVIHSNSQVILRININMETCGEFHCVVVVEAPKTKNVLLTIVGNVIFPAIKIKPNRLAFRRIVNHSFDRLLFWVANLSKVEASISFDMDDFKEFSISENAQDETEIGAFKLPPMSQKRLCMHFNPIDVTSQWFYLPIIVNDICIAETAQNTTILKSISQVRFDKFSKTDSSIEIPLVKVTTEVLTAGISFSKTNFQFRYYPHPEFETFNSDVFRVFNSGNSPEAFCLRTDNIKQPIAFYPACPEEVEVNKNSISAILEPGEGIDFYFQFQPTEPCSFKYKLPVYVKDKMSGAVYKFIHISGFFPEATFSVNYTTAYLEPVPLKTFSEIKLKLTARYHMQICRYKTLISDPDVKIKHAESQIVDPRNLENVFDIIVGFSTNTPRAVETSVKFYCKCGAECSVMIKGCSENCNLTNHAFLKMFCGETMNITAFSREESRLDRQSLASQSTLDIETLSIIDVTNIMEVAVNYNENKFPYFPSDSETTTYADHMNETLNSVEKWVNAEGFYGEKWHSIPDGFLVDPSLMKPEKSDKDVFPIITVLKNLAGPAITEHISIKKIWDMDSLDIVQYLWFMYDSVKKLLVQGGAFLPNVEPEYLLTYNQYTRYMVHIYPVDKEPEEIEEPLPFHKFKLMRKQNWLDLLLQTFKVFQLMPESCSKQKINVPSALNTFITSKTSVHASEPYVGSVYHPMESRLLYWLENVYNNNRNLFPNEKLPYKLVKLFDIDLRNGTILAVVTAVFCTYLINEFSDFYWRPNNYNEALYNACKLVLIWNMLHCRFRIKPQDIILANPLDMLMFVLNLYDFLPGMVPLETIEMYASLSQFYTRSISITNNNEFALKFTIHFFHNYHGCFKTNVDEIVLKPKSTKQVDVIYQAKRLEKVVAYLLFSGENAGYHLAKNRVYHLVGKSNLQEPFLVITLKPKIFANQSFTRAIQAPYKIAANYETYLVVDDSCTSLISSTKMVKWTEALKIKVPRRMFCEGSMSCDEEGIGEMTFLTSPVVDGKLSWSMLFTNSEVGDFMVQIDLLVKAKKYWEKIPVGITNQFLTSSCICDKIRNPSCPKNIKICVPARNPYLWNCLKECLLEQVTGEDEKAFWEAHYKTYAGLSIMTRILDEYVAKHFVDYYHMIKMYILQEITILGDKSTIDCPGELLVNSREDDPVEIVLHINTNDIPNNVDMIWCCQHIKIERFFKLIFTLCDS